MCQIYIYICTVSYFLTGQLAKPTRPHPSVIKEIKWLESCISYKHINALIKSQASSLSGWGNSTQPLLVASQISAYKFDT